MRVHLSLSYFHTKQIKFLINEECEKNIKAIIKDYLYNSANFYIVIIWLKHG